MKNKSIKFIVSEQYFPPETINFIEPNLYMNNHWLVPFNFFLFYETTLSTGIKLGRTSLWIVHFQNSVRQVWVRSKMASIGEHSLTLDLMGNTFKDLLGRNYWVNGNQTGSQ